MLHLSPQALVCSGETVIKWAESGMSLINVHQCPEYIPIPHLLVLDNDTPKFAIKRLFQLEIHHDSMHTSVPWGQLAQPLTTKNHFSQLHSYDMCLSETLV